MVEHFGADALHRRQIILQCRKQHSVALPSRPPSRRLDRVESAFELGDGRCGFLQSINTMLMAQIEQDAGAVQRHHVRGLIPMLSGMANAVFKQLRRL